ncbi:MULTISPECIES: SEC-C metal-binding domain-containing protein [unclassified Nocardiopsis]|uniref:SEC-C metal-binding domain-containing protein n=1 Tax=Nocardiopsis TaxID=2013 RepID=UPI00387B2C66
MSNGPLPASFHGVIAPPLWETIRGLDLPEEFLADLREFPAEAAENLLDMAEYLAHSDRPDLSRRLLEAVRAHPPTRESGQYAAFSLSERFRKEGDTEQADTLAATLADDPALTPGPAHMLAELFEETGDLERALRCFNIACRDALARPAEDLAPQNMLDSMVLRGRARVRRLLGLSEDDHDRAAQASPDDISGLLDPFGEPDDEDLDDDTLLRVEGVRPVFSRACLHRARELGLVDADTSDTEHCTNAERELREVRRTRPDVLLATVLVDADEIAAFARRHPDLTGTDLMEAWTEQVLPADSARPSPWPPGRNEPCWCGSARKYKKCCGSPNLR